MNGSLFEALNQFTDIKPNVEKTKEELPGLDNLPEPQCKK